MKNEIEKLAPENLQVALPNEELKALYKTTSSLVLTKEESDLITAEFDEKEIEIRPDGHIYLPQAYYRNRLNQSLGIGQWGLVIKGSHQEVSQQSDKIKTKFFLPGILVIRGCMVSEAVGEAELHADNPNQSIASCWESAKSDCITRCCKDLSIAMQIYSPNYIRKWQQDHAMQVWVENSNKPVWRKIDAQPFWNERGPVDLSKPFAENKSVSGPSEKKWLNKTYKTGGTSADWIRVTKAIADCTITLTDILKEFKLNSAIEKEVNQLFIAAQRGMEHTDPPKEKIDGRWYAILEKCKSVKDVNVEFLKYETEIKSNAALLNLFRLTKENFKTA
jgi:hypothetical protein